MKLEQVSMDEAKNITERNDVCKCKIEAPFKRLILFYGSNARWKSATKLNFTNSKFYEQAIVGLASKLIRLTSESGPKYAAGLLILPSSSFSFLRDGNKIKKEPFNLKWWMFLTIRRVHLALNTYLHSSSDCRLRSTSISIFFLKYSSLWLIISKHWFNVANMLCDVARNVSDSPCNNCDRNKVYQFPLLKLSLTWYQIHCLLLNQENSNRLELPKGNYPISFWSAHHNDCNGKNWQKQKMSAHFTFSRGNFRGDLIYRCNVQICPDRISLKVSISLIFSRSPLLPELWLNKMELDCSEMVLPWRINAVISMPIGTLYDCNTSTQCVLSSGVSARKYHTQLFTATSKRHSSNSWL